MFLWSSDSTGQRTSLNQILLSYISSNVPEIFSNANIISAMLTGCILQFKNIFLFIYFIYQKKKKKGSVLIFSLLFFPASREKCYKQIQAAIAKFREIKENINEGLKFYVTLQVRNVWLDCVVQVFI